MCERGAWSASWIPPPPALTAGRVGALEGNVDGEVPDERGGRDVALGGDLGDALLQTLWGKRGMSQGPALSPLDACCWWAWQAGWVSGVRNGALPLWEPSLGRRQSRTCSRGRQIRGTAGERGCVGGELPGPRAACTTVATSQPALLGSGLRPGWVRGSEAQPALLASGRRQACLRGPWTEARPRYRGRAAEAQAGLCRGGPGSPPLWGPAGPPHRRAHLPALDLPVDRQQEDAGAGGGRHGAGRGLPRC